MSTILSIKVYIISQSICEYDSSIPIQISNVLIIYIVDKLYLVSLIHNTRCLIGNMYIARCPGEELLNMSTQQRMIQGQEHSQDIAHKILLAIKDLRFGSVEVVIHDSKVVQIERKEKFRIDTNSSRTT
jgi:hypothetical protein